MSTDPPVTGSGDGTRPTTDGTLDNIGAGEKFTGRKNAAGEDTSSPAPMEKMQEKRLDVESTKHDDSDPFGLHEDPASTPNRNPAKA